MVNLVLLTYWICVVYTAPEQSFVLRFSLILICRFSNINGTSFFVCVCLSSSNCIFRRTEQYSRPVCAACLLVFLMNAFYIFELYYIVAFVVYELAAGSYKRFIMCLCVMSSLRQWGTPVCSLVVLFFSDILSV